jgi:hypothetical protein
MRAPISRHGKPRGFITPRLTRRRKRQAKALEDGVPTARVVRMRGAHHIFLSNEGETRAFLAGLK